MRCFLCYQGDTLDAATAYDSIADARADFEDTARELDRYGQRIEASLHFAPTRDELAEYPDRVLSLGPRGGLRIVRA